MFVPFVNRFGKAFLVCGIIQFISFYLCNLTNVREKCVVSKQLMNYVVWFVNYPFTNFVLMKFFQNLGFMVRSFKTTTKA